MTGTPPRSAWMRTTSMKYGEEADIPSLGAVTTRSARVCSASALLMNPCSAISASTVLRRTRFLPGLRAGSYVAGPLGIAASEAASASVRCAAILPK